MRTYTHWTHTTALATAKDYKSQHQCNMVEHGCYAYLERNGLLDKAFPNRKAAQASTVGAARTSVLQRAKNKLKANAKKKK